MAVSDLDVSRPRLIRDGSFLENDWREIAQLRRADNLRFAALQLGARPDVIRDYTERRQTVSEQQQIRDYLSLRPFDTCAAENLARSLVLRSARTHQ